ncbi:hypothetical protein [Sediminispirochaeta bajacaliforniensis]|nr:hypothetical protein [Sediminispirochaeta bajacaliforniensis]
MTGRLYRCAIVIKDAGVKLRCGLLVRFGLFLEEAALHGKVK